MNIENYIMGRKIVKFEISVKELTELFPTLTQTYYPRPYIFLIRRPLKLNFTTVSNSTYRDAKRAPFLSQMNECI